MANFSHIRLITHLKIFQLQEVANDGITCVEENNLTINYLLNDFDAS